MKSTTTDSSMAASGAVNNPNISLEVSAQLKALGFLTHKFTNHLILIIKNNYPNTSSL